MTSLNSTYTPIDETLKKIERLKNLNPYLIDVSLREIFVGSSIGATLEDKLKLLPLIQQFGFKNILLGCLNYQIPDELEVEDDFLIYLRDHHQDHNFDLSSAFASTSMGFVNAQGDFIPDPSQIKIQQYQIPHTIHEISLSQHNHQGRYDRLQLHKNLTASVQWLTKNLYRWNTNEKPRLIVNITDGCDAFTDNFHEVCEVLKLLATLPIEGVSFQDSRGTYLPTQVGAFTKVSRQILPDHIKLLVHIHSGSGYENAAVIEALLNGADGAWGALLKNGPLTGHASLSELILTLVRLGNPYVQNYQIQNLIPLITQMESLLSEQNQDPNILGRDAYCLPAEVFRQQNNRYMDVQPEAFGGHYRYRISPLISDTEIIARRLSEVVGKPPNQFGENILVMMIRMMKRSLRAGFKINFDQPENLVQLYQQALKESGSDVSS